MKYHARYTLGEILHYISLGQMQWPTGHEGCKLAERLQSHIEMMEDMLGE